MKFISKKEKVFAETFFLISQQGRIIHFYLLMSKVIQIEKEQSPKMMTSVKMYAVIYRNDQLTVCKFFIHKKFIPHDFKRKKN